ncbi:MAG: ATP synthase subunit I [Gammaproteobacteria bacterium]|nr:ATP synthase subunit I [Gammaproteobacteria bacterium]
MPRPPLKRVLLAESGLLALAVLGAGIMDPVTGKSLLIGGLIFLIPQSWFAWRVFRFSGAGAAREVVQGFYRGEAGKFLLTTAGFASAFFDCRAAAGGGPVWCLYRSARRALAAAFPLCGHLSGH